MYLYHFFEFTIITIVGYFVYYYFFMTRNHRKNKKPIEFAYLESRYQLRLDKINRKQLSTIVSLCNSFIIAFTVVIIDFIDSIPLQLLSGFVILVILITLTYYFIALYYKQKGLTKRCTILKK